MEENENPVTPEVIVNDSVNLNGAPYTISELSREVFGMIDEKSEEEIYSQPEKEQKPNEVSTANCGSKGVLERLRIRPDAVYIDGEGKEPEQMTLYVVSGEWYHSYNDSHVDLDMELSGALYYANVEVWVPGGVVGGPSNEEFIVSRVVFTTSRENVKGRELHINNSDLAGSNGQTLETEIKQITNLPDGDKEGGDDENNEEVVDNLVYQGFPTDMYKTEDAIYIVSTEDLTPIIYVSDNSKTYGVQYYNSNGEWQLEYLSRVCINESVPEGSSPIDFSTEAVVEVRWYLG